MVITSNYFSLKTRNSALIQYLYIYIMHTLKKHVKICQIVNSKCSEDEGLSVAFDVQFKRKY